jgi:hypothetical protein
MVGKSYPPLRQYVVPLKLYTAQKLADILMLQARNQTIRETEDRTCLGTRRQSPCNRRQYFLSL